MTTPQDCTLSFLRRELEADRPRAIDGNPIRSILDDFRVDLSSCGACEAVRRLFTALAQCRTEMQSDVWKSSCANIGPHAALQQLLEDPCSRDARIKPAGYAGDARTLDYLYLQDPGPQPVTSMGRALFELITGVPIAVAVRDRLSVLVDCMLRLSEHRAISVASIACGHARELDKISHAGKRRIRFWGIDHDSRSIDHCRSRFDSTITTLHVGTVRDILAGRVRIPPSDVVYASGLFDYLDHRVGAALLKRMYAALKTGGSLLIANLTRDNEELGYMEAVMDWWMHYRTEIDMRRLASVLEVDPSRAAPATFSTSGGRIAWLRIDRTD